MSEEAPSPHRGLAIVAALLPVLFVSVTCVLMGATAVGSHGGERVWHALLDMGLVWFSGIVATTAAAAIGLPMLLYSSALGRRVPTALSMGLAVLPWIVALVAVGASSVRIFAALDYADPAQRASLIAAGFAEMQFSSLFGSLLASALMAALGLGLAFASLALRAPKRSPLGAAIGLFVSLPIAGIALWATFAGGGGPLVLPAAGLNAALVGALAGLGVGADEPHGRSGALAAAAMFAAGLAVVLAAACSTSAATIEIFRALAFAASPDRGSLLAQAATEVVPYRTVEHVVLVAAPLAAAALGAFSLTRVRPSLGRMTGAAAFVAAVAIPMTAQFGLRIWEVDQARARSVAPWRSLDALEPLVASEGDVDVRQVDLALTRDGLRSLGGTGTSDRTAESMRGVLRAARDDLRDLSFDDSDELGVVVDGRLDAAMLRALFEAAAAEDVQALTLVAEGSAGSPEQREAAEDVFPELALALDSTYGARLRAARTVPPVAGRVAYVTIEASRLPDDLDSLHAGSPDDRFGDSEREPLYVVIGDGATPASLFDLANRARDARFDPIVVSELPHVAPPPPPDTPLGALGQPLGTNVSVGEAEDESGEGLFDTSLVTRMIRTRVGAIRACYTRELAANPALAGRVDVRFTVQPTGTISGATVPQNTTGSAALGQCVVQIIERLRFNPGPEGGSITFQYPFTFAPD